MQQQPIAPTDIVKGAQFKTASGIVWIIYNVEAGVASTSMQGGKKGNYRDLVGDCAAFLTEEKAVKIC